MHTTSCLVDRPYETKSMQWNNHDYLKRRHENAGVAYTHWKNTYQMNNVLRNSSNTSRRTYSDFQTPIGVKNTRRSRVFFKKFRDVLKSEEVLFTSV